MRIKKRVKQLTMAQAGKIAERLVRGERHIFTFLQKDCTIIDGKPIYKYRVYLERYGFETGKSWQEAIDKLVKRYGLK